MNTLKELIIASPEGDHTAMLIRCVLILIVTLIVAGVVSWLLARLVGHGVKFTKNQLDDKLLAAIQQPVYKTLLLIGLGLAALSLGLDMTATPLAVIKSLIIVLWFFASIRLGKIVLRYLSRDRNRISIVQARTLPLFENLMLVLAFGIAVYFIFIVWHINISAWVASAGIVGLAISFAAKDSLANLFAGVFILADAPYKLNDFIVLDSGERGCVTHIGIRSTRLLTRDDVEITIPNSIMGNSKIINETAGPHEKYRIRVQVGVAYGSDLDVVRDLLIQIANGCEDVCDDPEARVRFRGFGDSSLNIELLCWVNEPVLRGKVLDVLYTTIYQRFNQAGIEFPYPKRDVYLHQVNS